MLSHAPLKAENATRAGAVSVDLFGGTEPEQLAEVSDREPDSSVIEEWQNRFARNRNPRMGAGA